MDMPVKICSKCKTDPVHMRGARQEQQPVVCTLEIEEMHYDFCQYHAQLLVSNIASQLNEEYRKQRYAFDQDCPVCKTPNKRESYSEAGIGVVESHYFCDCCGFTEEQAYSPCYTTFHKGGKIKDRIRRFIVRMKNWKKTLIIKLSDDYCSRLGKYI